MPETIAVGHRPLGRVSRRRTGPALLLMTIVGRSYPRIIGANREKSWLLFETLLPFLGMLGFTLLYRSLHAPEEYVGFALFGGAMIAFWANVLWSMATQLYWEKENGNLALYIASPAPMTGILLGMALGGMLATSLRAIVILLAGSLIFQVHYQVSDGLLCALAFLFCLAALYGLGMMLSSLFLLFGREAERLVQVMQDPIQFLSGFYFPIKQLGQADALWVVSIIPLTLGLDALRQLAFRNGRASGFLDAGLEVGALAVLAVALVVTARLLLARVERLAIREGRLTEARR